jgi:RHS repeat-associated protein
LTPLPSCTNLGDFQNVSYGYDKVGNVTSTGTSIAVPEPPNFGGRTTQTFSYDDLNRLTDASGSYKFAPDKTNNYSYTLAYDNLHNITSKAQTNTVVQGSGTPVTQGKTTYSQAYAYTGLQPHAPSHIDTKTYAYDANGNQIGWSDDNTGQQRTIIWDEENRIQSIFDNGQEQKYKYDDAGQRIVKRSGNGAQGETAYVNQWFTIRNGQIGTKHVFIDTTRVASKLVKDKAYEKDTYYFHTDQLSSTNYVTDSGGKLYEHLEYFPSGESWIEEKSNAQQSPGFRTSYMFTGKELDEETGLYYFGARYYDPRTGLWPSTDPAVGGNLAKLPEKDGSPPASDVVAAPTFLNLYNYADANPLTKIDPDGRQAIPASAAPSEEERNQRLRNHLMDHLDVNHLIHYVKPNKYFGYMHWLGGSGRSLNMNAAEIKWKLDTKKLESYAWGSQVEIGRVGAYAKGDAKDHVGGVSGHFSGVISRDKKGVFHAQGTFMPYPNEYDFDYVWSLEGPWSALKTRMERNAYNSIGNTMGKVNTVRTGRAPRNYWITFNGPPAQINIRWSKEK